MITVEAVQLMDGKATSSLHKLECGGVVAPSLIPAKFNHAWRQTYAQEMAVALRIHDAQVHGHANLVFQPIVRLDESGESLYEEALFRIIGHSDELACSLVIPMMERLGLIRAVDRFVISTVLDLLEADPSARLGVNVSAASFAMDAWWFSVIDRLSVRPDVAARLTFELTETAPIQDMEAATSFANLLKHFGCHIALDDFGIGHSSIALARSLKPDVIKIDGELLRFARGSKDAGRTLRDVVALCRCLAPCVVIEGAEQMSDLRVAFEAGVDWIQGFIVQPPMSKYG